MKLVFNLAASDEVHLNRHLRHSGVTVTVLSRGGRENGVTYSVEGSQDRVNSFMSQVDWLRLDVLESEDGGPVDLGLNAVAEALEVLDQSVTKLRKALATGDYDMYLEALLEAEHAGKTRKTAVDAIQERIGGA